MGKLIDFIENYSVQEAEGNAFCTATFSLTLKYRNNPIYKQEHFVYNSNESIVKFFHDNLSMNLEHNIHINPIRDNTTNATHLIVTLAFLRTEAFKNSIRLIHKITHAWRLTVAAQPNSDFNNSGLSSGVFVFNNINKLDDTYDKQVSLIISEHNSLIELFSQKENTTTISIDDTGW